MSTNVKLLASTTDLSIVKDGLCIGADGTPDSRVAGLYDAQLIKDGLEPAVARKYQEHRSQFIAQAGHAFGTQALDYMKKNKDVENLTVTIPVGHDSTTFSVDRTRETSDGKGGRMEHNGYMTVGYTARGAGGSSGELKKVREHMKQLGATLLAK